MNESVPSGARAGRLAGRLAVVTGAGQGIGAGIVAAFVAEGARVLAWSRSAGPLERWRGVAGVEPVVCDVTDPARVAAAAAGSEAAGGPAILVNNAGWVPQGSVLEATDEDFARAYDINVIGAARCIRALLPGMIARGGGAIVNIASVVSSVSSAAGRCAYGASKAGLIGLTKSVALEFAPRGIRCNAVCPGTIDTEGVAARLAAAPDPAAARATIAARHRLNRLGRVEEVTEAVVWLASDAGGFTTGQTIVIDGGQSI